MEESVDSLQESLSSMESQPCSLAVNESVVQCEDKQIAVSENSAAAVATTGSAETPNKSNEEGDGPKSTQDQAPQITVAQGSRPEDAKTTVQSNPSKTSNTIVSTEPKNDSNKRDRGDQSENVQPEANEAEMKQCNKKGTKQQDQQNKVTPAAEQNLSQVISSWIYLKSLKERNSHHSILLFLQAKTTGPSVDLKEASGPNEVQVSGGSSNVDKDCQGDAAVCQSADAIQKRLSLSESEPESRYEETIQPGKGKGSSTNKKDTVRTNQPSLDQSVEDKAKQSRKKGKNEQDQQQKETPAQKQKMVFGPQKTVIKLLIFKLIRVEKLEPKAFDFS